jgi:tetratricopeptide (TPR) repeat protein
MSRRQPLVLVFEDLHWADTETRRFTEELAQRIGSFRVLLIVTARSHHEKTWAFWPSTAERELGPFSRTQTAEFLDVLLGGEPELENVKQLLAQKTEGNPFFLEECVRSLEESAGMSGAPGAYKLAVPISELEIPGSVHDVLAARIDALPAPERTALLRASVIGQRIDVGLLGELQQQSREALLALLDRLAQAGFLERTRIMPNLEYSFHHALTHDVAYATLLKRSRRYLHARVMAAIERRCIEQLPGKVELLAYHALAAEDWPRSSAYCRRAGQRKQSKSANQEAVKSFENALHAVSMIPENRRYRRSREIDLRLELVQSLFPLGRHDQVYHQLQEAEKLASDISDKRRLANVASALVQCHWVRGDLDRAIHDGKAALAVAERLRDTKCEIQVATRLGGVFLSLGDYKSASLLSKVTLRKIPREALHDRFGLLVVASACNRGYLACSLGELGRFKDAIKVGDEGIRIAEEAGHAFSRIFAYLFVAQPLLKKGDFARSLPLLKNSLNLCRDYRTNLLFPLNAASLGYTYVRMGNLSRGLDLLKSATDAAEHHAIKYQLSQELHWLAEAYLLAGNVELALVCARKALKFARQHSEKGGEAWALWLLGEIHCRIGEGANRKAEEYFYQAHDTAMGHLMSPLIAHVEFALGRLYCRREERHDGLAKLESAISLYRKLDMGYWLKLAESELMAARTGARVRVRVG